jgi:hypothetical protein
MIHKKQVLHGKKETLLMERKTFLAVPDHDGGRRK